jgi:N-acetylneuraminic acid mutarotase
MNTHGTPSPRLIVLLTILLTGMSLAAAPPESAASVSEGVALPFSVAGHCGGMVDGNPVIAGGSSWSADRKVKRWHTESLVFRNARWTPGPNLPQPISDAAYAWGPAGLYIAGGTDGKSTTAAALHLRSTARGATWQPLTSLPEPVEAAAGAILQDTFYIAGGFADGKLSNRLWALDLTDGAARWKPRATLPAKGRGYAALVACGEALYLFGGFASPPYQREVEIFSDAYRYDPAADRWQQLEGFRFPGYGWSATALSDRQVMLSGRVRKINDIDDQIHVVDLQGLTTQAIGRLVIQACCMPCIRVNPTTWWLPGGEPDTQRSRTERTSVVQQKGPARE